MQKIKRKSPKKRIFLFVLVALVIAGAIIWLWLLQHQTPKPKTAPIKNPPINGVNYNPPTPSEQQQGDANKQAIVNGQNTQSAPPPNQSPSTITVTVSRAAQASAGQPLEVRTTITGTSSGTCSIVFSKDGQQSFTKTFPVSFQATYATCDSANIDSSNFAVSGTWSMQITVQSASNTSAPLTQNVTIAK